MRLSWPEQRGEPVERDELLNSAQVALRLGITAGRWRAMVADGTAPKADDRGPAGKRPRPRWWQSNVDAFQAARPGSGRRGGARDEAGRYVSKGRQ